jgi:hypothetical protein
VWSCAAAEARSVRRRHMIRTNRVVVITFGLIVAGAVFGGIAGCLAFAIGFSISDGLGEMDLRILPVPAFLGGVLGAVTLPIGAWVLMRRVPLGLVVLGCVLGTVIGAVVAWVTPIGHDRLLNTVIGGFAGFLSAAVLLSLRSRAAV